jgi:Spy/CpxP family protein refolding chaperone
MKLNHLLSAGACLLLAGRLVAQHAMPEAIAEQLYTPDFLKQHEELLDPTDEQRNKFLDELDKTQARVAELQQQLQKETDALAALLKKDRPDEAAALAQADKALKVENEIKRVQLSLLVRIKAGLTPEQLAKLRELKGHGSATPEKLRRAMSLAKQWQDEGKDLTQLQQLKDDFDQLTRDGKTKEAEAALDKALKILEAK